MRSAARHFASAFSGVWNYVRAIMGDQAYERYLEVVKRQGQTPLSAQEFYVDSLKRRYSTVSRCC